MNHDEDPLIPAIFEQPGPGRVFDLYPTQRQLALNRSVGSENAFPFLLTQQSNTACTTTTLEIHEGYTTSSTTSVQLALNMRHAPRPFVMGKMTNQIIRSFPK